MKALRPLAAVCGSSTRSIPGRADPLPQDWDGDGDGDGTGRGTGVGVLDGDEAWGGNAGRD